MIWRISAFAILDQLAADVHRHAFNLTGELEGRSLRRCDLRTAVAAALQRPTCNAKHQWRGIWEIGVPYQLVIKVELSSIRHTFA